MNFFHGNDKSIFCQIFFRQLLGNIIFHIDTVADQNSFRLLIHRLLKLYNKAIVAALGQMLDRGESSERYDGGGRWLDIAGQYVTKREVEALLDALEEVGGYRASAEQREKLDKVMWDAEGHRLADTVAIAPQKLAEAAGFEAIVLTADAPVQGVREREWRHPLPPGASAPVLSGLKPSEYVVIGGVHLLREKQKIHPIDRENRPVTIQAGG